MKMFRKDGSKSIISVLVILTFFCSKTSSECTRVTSCSCEFTNGRGYDLTQLINLGPFKTQDEKNHTFIFQPCENERLGPMFASNDECNKGDGVSMCLRDLKDKSSISLGTVEETTMIIYPENSKKQSYLLLQHIDYSTTVGLVCCSDCETRLLADKINDIKDSHFLLMSPHVCELQIREIHGLSTGSLLVIIFFVFSGIYFIGGAMTLNLLRGATGWEMVPNHKFWRDLPSLVREGIDYTLCCCHVGSYDRI